MNGFEGFLLVALIIIGYLAVRYAISRSIGVGVGMAVNAAAKPKAFKILYEQKRQQLASELAQNGINATLLPPPMDWNITYGFITGKYVKEPASAVVQRTVTKYLGLSRPVTPEKWSVYLRIMVLNALLECGYGSDDMKAVDVSLLIQQTTH